MIVSDIIKAGMARFQQAITRPAPDRAAIKAPQFVQTPKPELIGPDSEEATKPLKAGILGQDDKKKKKWLQGVTVE